MIGDKVAQIEIKGEAMPAIDRGFVRVVVQVHTIMTTTEFERFRAKPSVLRLNPARGKFQIEIDPGPGRGQNRFKTEEQFRAEYEVTWEPNRT